MNNSHFTKVVSLESRGQTSNVYKGRLEILEQDEQVVERRKQYVDQRVCLCLFVFVFVIVFLTFCWSGQLKRRGGKRSKGGRCGQRSNVWIGVFVLVIV